MAAGRRGRGEEGMKDCKAARTQEPLEKFALLIQQPFPSSSFAYIRHSSLGNGTALMTGRQKVAVVDVQSK